MATHKEVVDGVHEMRFELGDEEGQGHGFLPGVLQAAASQG
jgi:hypothetical protein